MKSTSKEIFESLLNDKKVKEVLGVFHDYT